MHYDGVEIPDLKPGTQAYDFVERLARAFPGAVNTHDLAGHISPGRGESSQPARTAKMNATRAMRAALKGAGRPFDDPFRSGKKICQLTVLCHIR